MISDTNQANFSFSQPKQETTHVGLQIWSHGFHLFHNFHATVYYNLQYYTLIQYHDICRLSDFVGDVSRTWYKRLNSLYLPVWMNPFVNSCSCFQMLNSNLCLILVSHLQRCSSNFCLNSLALTISLRLKVSLFQDKVTR